MPSLNTAWDSRTSLIVSIVIGLFYSRVKTKTVSLNDEMLFKKLTLLLGSRQRHHRSSFNKSHHQQNSFLSTIESLKMSNTGVMKMWMTRDLLRYTLMGHLQQGSYIWKNTIAFHTKQFLRHNNSYPRGEDTYKRHILKFCHFVWSTRSNG